MFFPIVYCICSIFLVVVPLYSDTINTLVGISVALSGVPVYYICVYKPSSSRPAFLGKILGKRPALQTSWRFLCTDKQHKIVFLRLATFLPVTTKI